MSVLDDFTNEVIQSMQKDHTYRSLRHMTTPETSRIQLAGTSGEPSQELMLLASNSYLDLANIPELKKAMADAVLKWGTGSGGARLTTGNKTPHLALEEEIAKFKGEEAAITFGTGYMANVGTISALCARKDIIFSDELNHASIIDGIRLSRAKCYVYKHNDLEDLRSKIAEAVNVNGQKLGENAAEKVRGVIVTDAVFSMDGDLANLPELLKIAKDYSLLLMIDEAHATGVVGRTGRGLAEYFGCEHADVTVGTLSKAIACEGGFVAGKKQLIEFLKNKARSFIFTTAMAPAVAFAACNNLRYLENHPECVQKLQSNVEFFCKALQKAGLQVPSVPSAIVPIIVGDEEKALLVSAELQKQGILISAIRYPTVQKGSARLRASLMASLSTEDLEFAAQKIAQTIQKMR